jgi:hypothetical protein
MNVSMDGRRRKHLAASAFALFAAALSPSFTWAQAPANANVVGVWTTVGNWPLIGVHAVLTPGGNVLTYGTDGNGKQTGKFIYDVWDPRAGGIALGHTTLPNNTPTDIFCSAQAILPQSGNILIAGGDNFVNGNTTNTANSDSNIFGTGDLSLTRANSMNRARWYASLTALPNGEMYLQGGSGGQDRPEVRGADGTFRLLSSADTGGLNWFYPRNYVAPDGRVFGFDVEGRMYYVSPGGTGAITSAGTFTSQYGGAGSSTALFAPGKMLQFGGNSNGAIVIDINGATPTVTPTASMSSKRFWVNATALPNGKILATGGSEVENQLVGVNNIAEIWDPASGQWSQGASGVPARLYHSTALLLPDATVLVAGGGAPGPQTNTNAEIYYPPYLFAAGGAAAPRPQIDAAPTTITPGQQFSAASPQAGAIAKVSLVRLGSVTHSFNMEQRFIALSFGISGTSLNVTAPPNNNIAPPGYYMLFVVDNAGVPSVARILSVQQGQAGGIDPNIAYSVINRNSNKCVDIYAAQQQNGAAVIQWTCHGGANQKFKLIPTDSGFVRMVAQHSGKVVDVSGASTANRALIDQWDYVGGGNQQWRPVGVGGGFYKFIARHSGRALTIPGCSTADGTQLQQRTDVGNTCQQFKLQ